MHIIAIGNQKGGSAKTTTAAALAQAANSKGRKTLAIDLDPQGNLTDCTAADPNRANSFDLLTTTPPRGDTIQQRPGGLCVIPASWNLATLTTEQGSARRLQRALQPLKKGFDYIFIDTPPTAGELQYNALQAADTLIMPIPANKFGLQGLYQMTATARQFQKTNPELKHIGLVLTCYDGRTVIARDMAQTIAKAAVALDVQVYGIVRQGVSVQEAQATQSDLYEYAPSSNPAKDYMTVFENLEVIYNG